MSVFGLESFHCKPSSVLTLNKKLQILSSHLEQLMSLNIPYLPLQCRKKKFESQRYLIRKKTDINSSITLNLHSTCIFFIMKWIMKYLQQLNGRTWTALDCFLSQKSRNRFSQSVNLLSFILLMLTLQIVVT